MKPVLRRLDFLDGLRGVAALYVVLHHAALLIPAGRLSGPALVARFLLRHGHYAVSLFVVLSGYGLMLGAIKGPGGPDPGGTLSYLGRRARRILPPYYAALAMCWLLIAVVPALGRPSGTPWDRALPAFEPSGIAAHLLLIQNLDGRWMFRVSPSFWSLATAWQVCLLFPAMLRFRRRRGMTTVVAAAFALGAGLTLLSIPLGNPALRKLCPWYAGLFALGMAGADARCRSERPGRGAIVAGLGAAGLCLLACRFTDEGYLLLTDVVAGLVAVGLIGRWARISEQGGGSPSLSFLQARPMVGLGRCSYGLYLIHYPILATANLALIGAGWAADARLVALVWAAAPICVVASIPFTRAFDPSSRPAARFAVRPGSTGCRIDRRPGPARPSGGRKWSGNLAAPPNSAREGGRELGSW